MKTYTIWASIEEHDEITDEVRDAMGLSEAIGPFATLEEAQRFLISLPRFDPDGSPSIEDLTTQGLLP